MNGNDSVSYAIAPHTTQPIGGTLVRRYEDGTVPGTLPPLGLPSGGALLGGPFHLSAAQLVGGLDFIAGTANVDIARPVVLYGNRTLTRLGVFVDSADATSIVRVAIYSDHNFYPADLLVDTGDIAAAGAGAFNEVVVAVATAVKRRVWIMVNYNGIGGATLGANQASGPPPPFTSTLVDTLGYDTAGIPVVALERARAFGAFPATYPAGLTASAATQVVMPFYTVTDT